MSGTDAERVEIKPALTPEQWASGEVELQWEGYDGLRARLDAGWVDVYASNANGYQSASVSLPPADAKALGALCLRIAGPDGGPLFTHEHLAALFLLTTPFAGDPLQHLSEEERERTLADATRLAAELRDRLESTLPPEQAQSNAET